MGRNSGGVRGSSSGKNGYSSLAKEAVDYYLDGNGYSLNSSLRKGDALTNEEKLLMKGLDEITGSALKKDYTLYRGVPFETIFGEENKELLGFFYYKMSNPDDNSPFVMDSYNKVMSSLKKSYTDKGFMSTSTDASSAEGFGGNNNIVLQLKVPKGTKGIDLDANRSVYSTNQYEKEVLLTRGLTYKVGNFFVKDGKVYLKASIVKKS